MPTSQHCLERGADGYFGLAVSHVPADQPVHRLRLFHIDLGIENGLHLIRSFFKEEGAFKLALPGSVLWKSMSSLGRAGRLDGKKFACKIAHRPLGLVLGFRPASSAQGIELRTGFACPDIFANEVRLADGNIKFRRGLVEAV